MTGPGTPTHNEFRGPTIAQVGNNNEQVNNSYTLASYTLVPSRLDETADNLAKSVRGGGTGKRTGGACCHPRRCPFDGR